MRLIYRIDAELRNGDPQGYECWLLAAAEGGRYIDRFMSGNNGSHIARPPGKKSLFQKTLMTQFDSSLQF